jgi:hypothetical protein
MRSAAFRCPKGFEVSALLSWPLLLAISSKWCSAFPKDGATRARRELHQSYTKEELDIAIQQEKDGCHD